MRTQTPMRSTLPALALLILSFLLLHPSHASAALGDLDATFNLPASHLAVDPVRPRIYATLTGSNSVAVIDTSTLQLIAVIPVGSNPVGLAVSPDGSTLYVANSGSTTAGIGVIDLTTLTVLPSLSTPAEPNEIAVGLNGMLYLTTYDTEVPASIMQVSSSSGAIEQYSSTSYFLSGGELLQISPDRQTIYCGDTGMSPATLSSFDVSNGNLTLLQQNGSDLGGNGEDLEISHSGAFISYPNGGGQGDYQVFEIPTNDLAGINGSFDVGAYPTNIAFSPDDTVAYTAPAVQGHVLVFDTSTFQLTGTFPTPGDVSRMVTDSSGKYLFVAGLNSYYSTNPEIYVYDTGRPAPVITSATSQYGFAGFPFYYTITATNNATSYGATGLPPGFSINTATGIISGTCTATGTTQVVISASNSIGVAMANLTIPVVAVPPGDYPLVISVSGSGSIDNNMAGLTFVPIGSQVLVTASAASGYTTSGWSNLIFYGSLPNEINFGTSSLSFQITCPTFARVNFVVAPPAFTGFIVIGDPLPIPYESPFSFQIPLPTGIGPFTYAATGLPTGVSVNPSTGLISGTLDQLGKFVIEYNATNAGGTGYDSYSFSVDPALDVTAAPGGFTSPSGLTAVPLYNTVSLLATPSPGYYFSGWTGAFTSTSNPLLITATQPYQAFQANFIPTPAISGTDYDVVSGTSTASSGSMTVKVNKLGFFNGTIQVDRITYPLGGLFLEGSGPPINASPITIPRKNLPPLTVNLGIDLSSGSPLVTGSVSGVTWTSTLIPATPPGQFAGCYTFALTSDTTAQTIPAGSGYGNIYVNHAGVARIIGALPDGTRFSAAAPIIADTFAVDCPLYAHQGLLSGTVGLAGIDTSPPYFTGTLGGSFNWSKPATKSQPFTAPFSTTLDVVGTPYSLREGPIGDSAVMSFSGADLSSTTSVSISFKPNGAFLFYPPGPVTCTFNPLDGNFFGTFLDGHSRQPFHGVVLQSLSAGAGDFLNAAGSGSVIVTGTWSIYSGGGSGSTTVLSSAITPASTSKPNSPAPQ